MSGQRKTVKLHAEARGELQESVTFYRQRAGEHWAAQFKRRVRESLEAIAIDSDRFPPVADMPGVQKIRIEQFPFSLIYINRADHVWVVAVAHGSRKPGYWKGRVI